MALHQSTVPTGPPDLIVAWLVPEYLQGHPGHRSGEAHLCTDLIPLARRPKVADLDHLLVVAATQFAP